MAAGTVAGVYAEALLAVADSSSTRAAVVASCRDLIAERALSANVVALLDNPRVGKASAKQTLVTALAGRIEVAVVDLLKLLVDRNRLSDAHAVLTEVVRLADERDGAVSMIITTAEPLADDASARIRASITARTQRDLNVSFAHDPALIGGMTARTPALFVDGSVRRTLAELKRSITNVPLPDSLWANV